MKKVPLLCLRSVAEHDGPVATALRACSRSGNEREIVDHAAPQNVIHLLRQVALAAPIAEGGVGWSDERQPVTDEVLVAQASGVTPIHELGQILDQRRRTEEYPRAARWVESGELCQTILEPLVCVGQGHASPTPSHRHASAAAVERARQGAVSPPPAGRCTQ